MAQLIQFVFGCCFSRKSRLKSTLTDEESRLLPAIPPEEPNTNIPVPTLVIVDHQRLKDKLDLIVRSTEGKMVNLNSSLPFNLHNHSPATAAAGLPTSSRSASTSTNARTTPPRPPLHNTSNTSNTSNNNNHNHNSNSMSTPLSSRQGSLSRSSSMSLSEDPSRRPHNRPILNLRLVNNGYGATGRRGRAPVRAGLIHDDDLTSPKGKAKQHHSEQPQSDDTPSAAAATVADNEDQQQTPQAKVFQRNQIEMPEASPLPPPEPPKRPFKIQNMGNIAVSWGD